MKKTFFCNNQFLNWPDMFHYYFHGTWKTERLPLKSLTWDQEKQVFFSNLETLFPKEVNFLLHWRLYVSKNFRETFFFVISVCIDQMFDCYFHWNGKLREVSWIFDLNQKKQVFFGSLATFPTTKIKLLLHWRL